MFYLHAANESGVTITNTPAQNTSTVAEHAISLYFAVKRRIADLDRVTKEGEMWKSQGMCMGVFKGVMPRICEEEVVGIIGYGALGMYSFLTSHPLISLVSPENYPIAAIERKKREARGTN